MLGRCSETSGETWQAEVTAARSQSHRSTAGLQEQHKAKSIWKRMVKPGLAPWRLNAAEGRPRSAE